MSHSYKEKRVYMFKTVTGVAFPGSGNYGGCLFLLFIIFNSFYHDQV